MPLDEVKLYSNVLRDEFKKELEEYFGEENMLSPEVEVKDKFNGNDITREITFKNRGPKKSITITLGDFSF